MPKIAALGGLSSRGFGEFAQQTAANYIEDVFSTYLYTGNSSTQTITNGIDLSGKGGLIWIKSRSVGAQDGRHQLFDTARGTNYRLISDSSAGQGGPFTTLVTSVSNDSFSLGSSASVNYTGESFVSWVFRKQPKFFDVVTGIADASTGLLQISHSLGSVPGMVFFKPTSTTGDWVVWHRSLSANNNLYLNTSGAASNQGYQTSVTSTTVTMVNGIPGATYVAYIFAHDAGGFGADGSQNVISCGSFTTDGSGNATVTLGYEPQYVLLKRTNAAENWTVVDNMRGFNLTNTLALQPNVSDADLSLGTLLRPSSTGFTVSSFGASNTYIYMAIRRGPMRTPTDATKVFAPVIWTGNNTAGRNIETGFTLDLFFGQPRTQPGAVQTNTFYDRLRGFSSTAAGNSVYLRPLNTDAEGSVANYIYLPTMNGFSFGSVASGSNQYNNSSFTMVSWNFKRAPGFFDIVCYTGTGVARTINHNLGVVPELMIVKSRSNSTFWITYSKTLGNNNWLALNSTDAALGATTMWNTTNPTSAVFSLGNAATNLSAYTYVAYLFATCPGVSKVGSYTGTGTTQTIDCGFSGGVRYVLIKRTDSTGDWWAWDTARGMVAGTDPRLAYNSIAAETNANWVYTTTGGFQIVTSDATVNASGGTYIYLAIA